ncbi:hypothetical protein FMUND_1763 [Fusarium mundagurra]|uniref:Uncharacterized protein n=1 Tax=Fusarium mundagurra TaxID=1567541 RepID=A0A8H6DN34_9HYPO|nr:hypothetical protein FMUND_1763 [Fusarium mundagurra]
MEFNISIVLISFLVGAVFASPLAKRNITKGLSEKLKGTDFSRPEPVDRCRNDPRFALGPSLFAAPATRNSSFVARRIIQKRPDTEEYEPKFNQIRQSGNKTKHEYKLPKHDGNIDVSLDKIEYSEHEKTLVEALLKSLNKTLEESEKENLTDKDEDKEHEEDDSDSDSDDEEDAKKGIKKVFGMIQKRDDEKEEEKPYLWPEHNRPKVSKDGKFRYFIFASETNRHEKAQQEREQKLDIVQHELQKEMDAKLQQEHSRLKHENEMKFNASKPEKDE